jgi:hypothetical protein
MTASRRIPDCGPNRPREVSDAAIAVGDEQSMKCAADQTSVIDE